VVAYNRIQERSVRRAAERAFGSGHADVLLEADAQRREPVVAAAGKPQPPAGAMPDERIDYVMLLRIAAGIPSAAVLDQWKAIEKRFSRRALLAGSAGSGWRVLAAGDYGACNAVRASLQLVSRDGVVREAELVEFRSAVETLASKIGAQVTAPGMREALETARALDRLCADTDIQVALHVVSDTASDAAIDAAGAALGQAPCQVSRRPGGLSLVLDVPRTADLVHAYEAMSRMAQRLAVELGGRVVDDRGNALEEAAFAAIEAQLEPVRAQLAGAGIEAGGTLALRLFS
jgi:hypothetical protein